MKYLGLSEAFTSEIRHAHVVHPITTMQIFTKWCFIASLMVLQLMVVIAEQDAALLEKSTTIAEKMAAWVERDVALADQDSALLKRDVAISALAKVEKESSSCARKRPNSVGGIYGSKLLQRVGFSEHYSLVGEFQPNSIMTFDAQCTWVVGEHLAFQGTRTQT